MHHMPICWDAVGDLNTSPSKCTHHALLAFWTRQQCFVNYLETVTTHGAFFDHWDEANMCTLVCIWVSV